MKFKQTYIQLNFDNPRPSLNQSLKNYIEQISNQMNE